jgi:hypothetical protein
MLAGITGAAFAAAWWWRRRSAFGHYDDNRGEVIFSNAPRASEID